MPVAAIVCFVFGFLFGLPALRLEGIYLALATFALAIAIPQVLKSTVVEHWTGGVQGIVIIKPDAPFGLPLNSDQWLYVFTVVVAIVMYVCAVNLVNSRTGRALIAIRDHPVAASAMGINVSLYKSLTFGVSALYTGVAGALGAIAIAFVAPDSFTFVLAVALFVGLVVGGVALDPRHLIGAGSSCCSCRTLPSTCRRVSAGAVYGVILLLVIYLMPTGAAGLVRLITGKIGAKPLGHSAEQRGPRNGGSHAECRMRALIASVALSASRWRRPAARAEEIRSPARATPRSRSATSSRTAGRPRPTARSARRIGGLLQQGQRRRRHQRPQDQLHHLRRRLFAAEDRRAGRASWSRATRCC